LVDLWFQTWSDFKSLEEKKDLSLDTFFYLSWFFKIGTKLELLLHRGI